jgi:hypothetical protein
MAISQLFQISVQLEVVAGELKVVIVVEMEVQVVGLLIIIPLRQLEQEMSLM